MSRPYRFVALLSAIAPLAAPACDDERAAEPVVTIPDACNPLGGMGCLTPWPSAAYLAEADTATGYRVDIPGEALPISVGGATIDPEPYGRYDGFAPSGAIIAAFPGGVSAEGLPTHADPAASLGPDSATVLIDMDTGERVLHFAEVDMNAAYPDERVLVIRPLVRMQAGRRHAVAIRATVRDASGDPLPVPPGFAAVRDGKPFDHPLMERVRPRYDDIFATLEENGVDRDDVVLAWDFVTASDDMLTADLLHMRSTALPQMIEGLTFSAEEVASDPALVYRALQGTIDVPSFLTAGEENDSVMVRGADGVPALNGTHPARFAALIPACVAQPEAVLPVPVIVFGHGLFGTGAGYLDDQRVRVIAEELCFVVVAGDFIGLTSRQLGMVANLANNLDRAGTLTDKLAQSIIDFIAIEHMVRGPFAGDERFQVNGQPVLDPGRVHYLGASLGGIMGNVFMAYDPHITRGVLGVPGGAWSLLFERSTAWGALQAVVKAAYRDPYVYQILIALLSMRLEPYDPITTAPHVIESPLPDTPAKQILMYEAVGDSLVSNLSTEMVARSMGISVTGPSLYVPYGFAASTEPLSSGLTIYDEHPEPSPPDSNVPPAGDNGTHGGVNERGAVLRQMQRFLFEGEVVHPCIRDGEPAPCDCATSACE